LEGLIVRFKLEATNVIGSTKSTDYLAIIIAGVPTAPSVAPDMNALTTNSSQIGVTLTLVTADGGSTIITYALYMDDG
jgi:hypothetical protein